MNSHLTALAAALAFAIGGVVTAIDNLLSFVAVVTAAFTGAARYAAVLFAYDQSRVERATARGFFVGLAVSVALLTLDRF